MLKFNLLLLCITVLFACSKDDNLPKADDRSITLRNGPQGEDADNDGVLDYYDNCMFLFNPQQGDSDNDGVGNICDNCITGYNPNQEDTNNNGIGDVCEDNDGDGVLNDIDNCIDTPNPQQTDSDNDGIGDLCDNTTTTFGTCTFTASGIFNASDTSGYCSVNYSYSVTIDYELNNGSIHDYSIFNYSIPGTTINSANDVGNNTVRLVGWYMCNDQDIPLIFDINVSDCISGSGSGGTGSTPRQGALNQ